MSTPHIAVDPTELEDVAQTARQMQAEMVAARFGMPAIAGASTSLFPPPSDM